ERPRGVRADAERAAVRGLVRALVDVVARRAVALVAGVALAREGAVDVRARGVGAAVVHAAHRALVDVRARLAVPRPARVAGALVAAGRVLAGRVGVAAGALLG